MNTTDSYIMGITEGRQMLNALGGRIPKDDLISLRDNAEKLMQGASKTMRAMYEGERDFWQSQIGNKKRIEL